MKKKMEEDTKIKNFKFVSIINYEDAFAIEKDLTIALRKIQKDSLVLIGKITPSNQQRAELIKSELDNLEE